MLSEDAQKVQFATESLDQPDPFLHNVVVPESVQDAIR